MWGTNVVGCAVLVNVHGYLTLLVENGAVLDQPSNWNHMSPFQWAAAYGKHVAAQELCDLGANINFTTGQHNWTPACGAKYRFGYQDRGDDGHWREVYDVVNACSG